MVMLGRVEEDVNVVRAQALAPEFLAQAGRVGGNGLHQTVLVLNPAAEHARDRAALAPRRNLLKGKTGDAAQFIDDPLAQNSQGLPDRTRIKVAQIGRTLDTHGLEL